MHTVRKVGDNIWVLGDFLGGFDCNLTNPILDLLALTNKGKPKIIVSEYIFDERVAENYKDFEFRLDIETSERICFKPLMCLSDIKLKKKFFNFSCSFNGSGHVSRQFLTASLYKLNWVNPKYFSKNFSFSRDLLAGNIHSYFHNNLQERFYRKFIISDSDDAEEFYHSMHAYDYNVKNHVHNLQILSDKINSSFIQIVGETCATSYYPFITEKFLYPLILKTLWVAYAQPGYYHHLEKYYGFKKYDTIFSYEFDQIENPVIRLVELLTMLGKFEKLSNFDWHDLYLLQSDIIEYNYNHYFSKEYLSVINKWNMY